MESVKLDYIRAPDDIYRKSFELVRRETDLSALPAEMRTLAVRLVHACGLVGLVEHLAFSPDAFAVGKTALEKGKAIFCDVNMVRAGIIKPALPAGNEVICTLENAEVKERARTIGNTRSAAAVDFWDERLEGAIVAIGNAPTALFRLLEHIRDGRAQPALVIAMPVGFVGAAESKRAAFDMREAGELTSELIAVHGRLGGSALASAAVNALAAGASADARG